MEQLVNELIEFWQRRYMATMEQYHALVCRTMNLEKQMVALKMHESARDVEMAKMRLTIEQLKEVEEKEARSQKRA